MNEQKRTAFQERDQLGDSEVPFVCPRCHRALERANAGAGQGALRCPTHGEYPVLDGIPSFLPGSLPPTSASFEEHWRRNSLPEISAAKLRVARRFLSPLRDVLRERGRATVLDAGCGDGVHRLVLDEDMPDRIEYVGLDGALSALLRARARSQKPWTAVHADLLALPLPDESLDCAFSFGVVAYTGDWSRALRELVRVTRPGGLVGLWSYPKPAGLLGVGLSMVRGLTGAFPSYVQARLADILVPFLPFLPTCSGMTLKNSTWRACREVVLVTIAPRVLDFPTEAAIQSVAESLRCHILPLPENPPITVWLRKQARDR